MKVTEIIGKSGTKIYVINLGDAYFITPYKGLIEEVSKDSKKVFDKEFIRAVEEYEITPPNVRKEMRDIIERELNEK